MRSLLRWLEGLFFLAGAGMFGWSVLVVVDAMLAQRTARETLEQAARMKTARLVPAFDDETVDAPPFAAIESGDPVAALSIPRVQLSATVLHGTDARTLRRGPGHLENTPYPGEPGNSVIAGHRDSFFWPLQNIVVGDDIFLDTGRDQFHYRVTSVRIVKPTDVSVLGGTDGQVLTLITCYPFSFLGRAPDRFIVRATRVGVPGLLAQGESVRSSESERPAPVVVDGASVTATDEIAASDDEGRIRQVVKRYLAVQDGGAAFSCSVSIDTDTSTSDCEAPGGAQSGLIPYKRTFTLQRAGAEWAIRSIAVR